MFCSPSMDWGIAAAWAQAILSAFAIFAAVWLQDRDRRLQADERQQMRKAAILAMARHSVATLKSLDRRATERQLTQGRFEYYDNELSSDISAIASVELSGLENPNLAAEPMKLRRLLTTAQRRLGSDKPKVAKGGKVPPSRFTSQYNQAEDVVNRMMQG